MAEIPSMLPIVAMLVSLAAVPVILALGRRPNLREAATMAAALAKFGVVAVMARGVLDGDTYVASLGELATGIELVFRADLLGILFALLASGLWIITSLYSIGYMRGLDAHAQTRYFASFAASLSATMGVAFAGNLLTLFVCYELLTIATYPLVTHDETDEARAAGRKYLAYTFVGGVLALAGTALVLWLTGSTDFAAGGIAGLAADPVAARVAFVLLISGFGVKAALMPLHSWLPDAMVAPTPVSGLLHAVAVVKSGVFAIARVILDVYGTEALRDLGMGLPLAVVAMATVLIASVIALRQDNLKRRLAYSTISQLSYIVLGLALLNGHAILGGLLHVPAHAFMKLTLFFCAGAIHVETHTNDISEMAGIGKRMPLTMAAFAVAAAGMAGMPLLAGFVSKWYLVIGAIDAGQAIFGAGLLLSGILNVAYFWPIVYQAFFESEDDHDTKPLIENPIGGRGGQAVRDPHPDDETDAVPDGGTDSHSELSESATPGDHDDPAEAGAPPEPEHVDHIAEDHHGGPPPGGWDRVGWRGGESSWFVLGPILAAAGGALLLGVVPRLFVFLRIVTGIVRELPGVGL